MVRLFNEVVVDPPLELFVSKLKVVAGRGVEEDLAGLIG